MFPCPMIFNIQSMKEMSQGMDHAKETVSFIQSGLTHRGYGNRNITQVPAIQGPRTEKGN